MSFVAGAAVAFVVSAAGWSVLQSAPVAPAAADQKLGMALMSAVTDYNGNLVSGSGATSVTRSGQGVYYVYFDRSVASCAVNVTPFSVSGVRAIAEGDRVLVGTMSGANAVDMAFNMIVFCPK